MNLQKVWTIAQKDVRITFGDRNLLLVMFAAPLLLTFIIGAAFSSFTGSDGDVPINSIAVAVVNEDQGTTVFLAPLNYGAILSSVLIPDGTSTQTDEALHKLIKAQALSRQDAIAQVDQGKLVAAILIPANFSASLDPTRDKPLQTQIAIYRDTGSPITASIVSSVVHSIVNKLTTSSLAIYAAKAQVTAGKASPLLLVNPQAIVQAINDLAKTAFPITLQKPSASGTRSASITTDPIRYFAPAMAIFFLTFTMAGGAGSIIDERNNWTLQRMLSSPTSRTTILAGKFGGTYLNGVLQITVLILATALLAPLLGSHQSIWGNNLAGIVLITLSAVAAAVGLGTLIAGIARTAQQVNVLSNALLTITGLVGGAFFNIASMGPIFQTVSKLTLNYWATNAYSTLAQTGDLVSVLPDIGVLLLMFIVFFGIGLTLFNRHLNT